VPRQAIKDGIVYITEDRKVSGYFETMSIEENIYLGHLASKNNLSILTSKGAKRNIARRFIDRFRIRAINVSSKVVELSGGNQQKVVLAKALTGTPKDLRRTDPRGRRRRHRGDPPAHPGVRRQRRRGRPDLVVPARDLRSGRSDPGGPGRPHRRRVHARGRHRGEDHVRRGPLRGINDDSDGRQTYRTHRARRRR
jgi:hypothetical protein